jgi:hypothetical protein
MTQNNSIKKKRRAANAKFQTPQNAAITIQTIIITTSYCPLHGPAAGEKSC